MIRFSVALAALCLLAASAALAAKPPSRAHADAVVAEAKAGRDAAIAQKDEGEAGFVARYDYAAALFNVNRFDEAAAEFKAAAETKAAAKNTTYFVMAHTGVMLMDLARQDPKGASEELSIAHKRLPASFRETPSAQSYLTTLWYVKSGGKKQIEMGELFRPASVYEKITVSDPDEGTYFQYRLTLAGVGLRTAMIKAKKGAEAGTVKLGELPALRKQL